MCLYLSIGLDIYLPAYLVKKSIFLFLFFLFCPETELTDLEMTLKSLALPDLKTLAKSYHLNVSSKTGIVDILLKKSKQSTIGTMFGAKSKQHDPEAIMLLR